MSSTWLTNESFMINATTQSTKQMSYNEPSTEDPGIVTMIHYET